MSEDSPEAEFQAAQDEAEWRQAMEAEERAKPRRLWTLWEKDGSNGCYPVRHGSAWLLKLRDKPFIYSLKIDTWNEEYHSFECTSNSRILAIAYLSDLSDETAMIYFEDK